MQEAFSFLRRHSAAEWAQGNKRTSGGGTYISKMVSRAFPSQAVQVTECLGEWPWKAILSGDLSFLGVEFVLEAAVRQLRFLRRFTLELQEVQEMLESTSGSVLMH